MSQPSVASYFATRKRPASTELLNKSKVLIIEDNRTEGLSLIHETDPTMVEHVLTKTSMNMEIKKDSVVRNLKFDMGSKLTNTITKTRSIKTRQSSIHEESRQSDIREILLKVNKEIEDDKIVVFEKLGSLSPKKLRRRRASKTVVISHVEEKVQEPAYTKTPTKESHLKSKDMSCNEIKVKITTSARLNELRARIAKFKNCEDKLEKLEQVQEEKKKEIQKNKEKLKIKEFERIELEIPMSPQKSLQSPNKFFSPTKMIHLSPKASPARRLLFEPKETPASPIKGSPSKTPAYQRYQSLIETEDKALPLPYNYRFLAEVFRSIDTVSAMLYNRREIITFNKLKPAVQELVRRNFTIDHLAQIKTLYPDAFMFRQEKLRSFGTSNPEKYELIITPIIECNKNKSGRNTPDAENVLKSALETHMGPSVLLERRRKLYDKLLEIVKDEHEKFLLSLETPMNIPKDSIARWHPEFDIENCKSIEKSELPYVPQQEKVSTAKEVLERANKLFNDNSRMQKAIERLADNKLKSNIFTDVPENDAIRNINASIIDTPPNTPKVQKSVSNPALKGIPMALLEKVRAKQAAKALEMMTRSLDTNRDLIMYSRLPDFAKIIRNIFVSEKKSVLTVEFVIKKLNDSYRTKLTNSELENHIKLLCKLLPLWATIQVVRKVNYLKLAKDIDIMKVVKRLELLAEAKS